MLWYIFEATLLTTCHGSRIRTYRQQEFLQICHTASPPCEAHVALLCPIQCNMLEDEPGSNSKAFSGLSPFQRITAIDEDADMTNLAWMVKTDAYKSFWPASCDAQNEKGEKLNLDVNGFVCKVDGREIPSIMNFRRWQKQSHVCCGGLCVNRNQCGKAPLSLEDALHNVSQAVEAFPTGNGYVKVQTRVGEDLDLHSEIRIPTENLKFQGAVPVLFRDAGKKFLAKLSVDMAVLMSMQLTWLQKKNKESKTLPPLCPQYDR